MAQWPESKINFFDYQNYYVNVPGLPKKPWLLLGIVLTMGNFIEIFKILGFEYLLNDEEN